MRSLTMLTTSLALRVHAMQWTHPALHTLVTALPESWLLHGTYATASLGRSCRHLLGAGLDADTASGAGFRIDHRHVVFHVNGVERACDFAVAVTDAREIALVRAAKRYRGGLASVKSNVGMLLLDFAIVSGAPEKRNHAACRAGCFAGDRGDFLRDILLPWRTLSGRAIGSMTQASAYDSHPANPQAPQLAPGRQALTASILGSTFTAKRLAMNARAIPLRPENRKEDYPYHRYGPNILHALTPQEKPRACAAELCVTMGIRAKDSCERETARIHL